jgi:hypothetical protein
MIDAWDLPFWLGMDDVVVGETDAPPKGPSSQAGQRVISAWMVLFAYLIVGTW